MNIYQKDHTQTPEIFTLIKEHQNSEAIHYLKKNPEEIHLKGWMDDTPLHTAALSGNFEMVKYLIKKNANVNAERSGVYATPLCWAENYEIAKYLLDNGATMNDKELFVATSNDKVKIIDLLITNGAQIDQNEPQYLKCKSIESIMIYLNHKIDLNGCDNNNSNLLHKLAWLDLPTVFDFAYNNGCEWRKDNSQRTPYYLAKQGKCENILNHFRNHYIELISNKVENIVKEDYVYQRIFFIKQSSFKSDWFIALTKNSNLIRYLKQDDKLIVDQIVNIDTSTIRNFTFDESNHVIVPTGDNQLLILEQKTFNLIRSVKLPNDLVLDQITYLPSKSLYIGSSQNWEIVLLSKDFKIISRTKAEDGTLFPKIN
ncbi:ankyrin repeat domain-containing protein, partial [Flavobacterium sp. UGB4466]|uniref:ankyrin repeat domain-containing protein n=1 Tax=Flavobacterium sp. UGB4466 TaxID=2730889 RepID=UPI00192B335C